MKRLQVRQREGRELEHQLILKPARHAPVEFPVMIAQLFAVQSASATAAAQIHHEVARRIANSRDQALATLMQARPGWRAAAGALRGSFHPGVAALISANGS